MGASDAGKGKRILWGSAFVLFFFIILFWVWTLRSVIRDTVGRKPQDKTPSVVQSEIDRQVQSMETLFDRFQKTVQQELPKTTETVNRLLAERMKERLQKHPPESKPLEEVQGAWVLFTDPALGFRLSHPRAWEKNTSRSLASFDLSDGKGTLLTISHESLRAEDIPVASSVRQVIFHGVEAEERVMSGYRSYTFIRDGRPWFVRYTYDPKQAQQYDELWRIMNETFTFL